MNSNELIISGDTLILQEMLKLLNKTTEKGSEQDIIFSKVELKEQKPTPGGLNFPGGMEIVTYIAGHLEDKAIDVGLILITTQCSPIFAQLKEKFPMGRLTIKWLKEKTIINLDKINSDHQP